MKGIMLLILAFILLGGAASAQTLVTGKIYSGNYDNSASNASVHIECSHNGSINLLDTNSMMDGTYAVRFDENNCSENDSVKVSASLNDYSSSNTDGEGKIKICTADDCSNNSYLAIVNILMIKPVQSNPAPSGGSGGREGGGGSGGYYYFCGNNKCDTGETPITCQKDCGNITVSDKTANTDANFTNQTINLLRDTSNQGITGAVTGFFGSRNGLIVSGFIIIVGILAIVTYYKRK